MFQDLPVEVQQLCVWIVLVKGAHLISSVLDNAVEAQFLRFFHLFEDFVEFDYLPVKVGFFIFSGQVQHEWR